MTAVQPAVRVYCLGHFRIERGGGSADDFARAQAKPLALLKTLIALGGQNVPEDQLLESLWPDADGDAAHQAFTSTLYRLRQLIGQDAVPLRQRQVSLDSRYVWSDCGEFSRVLGEAEAAPKNGGAEAGAAMDSALSLYRGPFLEGEFELPEILATRDKLHGRFLRVLRETGAAMERTGKLEEALRLYQKGLEADPVSEELCQALMRALGQAGHAAEAEAAYQRLRRNLEAEGGGKPSAETERARGASPGSTAQLDTRPMGDRSAPRVSAPHPGPRRLAALRRPTIPIAAFAMLALIVVAGALAAQRWLRPAATDGRSQDEPPSIAVLPFTNMSGDPEQEYFADGISETLITILSKLPSLVVIARNSTFAYKGKSEDVRQIGKDLGVRYVLEGSFQKSRDAVRVSAQLIDAMNGKHLWAENYDRSLNDIFAIQDEITKQIVSQMDAKFIAGTDASANQTSTKSAKAYELFLKANQLYYQRTKESFAEARKTLEDSLAIDSRYAAAFDLLGEIHMDQAWERWGPSTEESFQLAKSNFESALEADPNFAQAVADLGWYYWFVEHDFERGKSLAAKSVALDPGSANSHDILGAILLWTGQPERALRELQLALKLNPTPYPVRLKDLGWAYFVNGRYEEALQFGQRAHAMAPQETATLRLLVLTHVELGQVDEAHRFVQLLMQEMPYFSLAWYERNILPIIQTEALRNRLLNGLRKAGVPEK